HPRPPDALPVGRAAPAHPWMLLVPGDSRPPGSGRAGIDSVRYDARSRVLDAGVAIPGVGALPTRPPQRSPGAVVRDNTVRLQAAWRTRFPFIPLSAGRRASR